MLKLNNQDLIVQERIAKSIYIIRNHKVIIDSELADMYGVETRILNQAVKRNMERFPADFMFQVTQEEWENLKSQFVTSSWGGRRTPPLFVKMRQWASNYEGVGKEN
jgi:superfamily I DNA and RNA helicase